MTMLFNNDFFPIILASMLVIGAISIPLYKVLCSSPTPANTAPTAWQAGP